MDHDEFYGLMMDALDGEILVDDQQLLEAHLQMCSSCQHEWQAMMAIDTLFRRAPLLDPAPDFSQRTLARLPDQRARLLAIGTIYVTLLLSGILPLLLLGGGLYLLFPMLQEPAVVDGIMQLLGKSGQLLGAIGQALLNGFSQLLIEQPSLMGWVLVMIGILFLWGGVYRQLLTVPARQQIY